MRRSEPADRPEDGVRPGEFDLSPEALELLGTLLSLPADVAAQVRRAAPRRRAPRPQSGPGLDLGS